MVESLTDDLEEAIGTLMRAVEDQGGAVSAIEQGFQKGEIERAAYQIAREVVRGERVVVGVNRYVMETEDPYEPLRVDPAIEAGQCERLARLRAERDGAAVGAALERLQDSARIRQRAGSAEAGARPSGDRRRGVQRSA